ncbi:alpha/beta hydrolase [Campylobacter sp.]|uniref:alpha/beta hydrolase n=1 Tax=Campylobacter sp. TaxID=205 RepID=UPI0026F691CD|nr:alpha/beta hydrolase [Campylobacter sp.]
MKNAVIYIHGKGGSAEEAKYYKKFFGDEYEVMGFKYKSKFPWEAKAEFPKFFDFISSQYSKIYLIANSIGAYYSMLSLADKSIEKAMFISPIVDMEKLILNMMARANVSEKELCKQKVVTTTFGEPLSWGYLVYVRKNPINWKIPTCILFGEKDNMSSLKTMTDFANKIGAALTVMKNAEHWFHTEEHMIFLDDWFKEFI